MSGIGTAGLVTLVGRAAASPLSASAQQPPNGCRRWHHRRRADVGTLSAGLPEHGYLESQKSPLTTNTLTKCPAAYQGGG